MIKLQIVGNLGKDCIVKDVNGKNVINFSSFLQEAHLVCLHSVKGVYPFLYE
jgi:hypothetical protein